MIRSSFLRPLERVARATGRWFLRALLDALPTSLELCFRRPPFGERYTGLILRTMFILVFVAAFTGGVPVPASLMPLFCTILLLLGAYHLVCIQRNRTGILMHSLSTGQSLLWWPALPWTERTSRLVIEPLLTFFVGSFYSRLDPIFGAWLISGSISLFFKSYASHTSRQSRVLDALDNRIEAQEHNRRVTERLERPLGESPFHEVQTPPAAGPAAPDLRTIFNQLDPGLQEMLRGQQRQDQPPETAKR